MEINKVSSRVILGILMGNIVKINNSPPTVLKDHYASLGDRTTHVGDRSPSLGDRFPSVGDRYPLSGTDAVMHKEITVNFSPLWWTVGGL